MKMYSKSLKALALALYCIAVQFHARNLIVSRLHYIIARRSVPIATTSQPRMPSNNHLRKLKFRAPQAMHLETFSVYYICNQRQPRCLQVRLI